MTTEKVSRELVQDEYRTAIDSGLNDEQAFHYVMFMIKFKPSMFTYRDYYADTWIMRFRNGCAIAYADTESRLFLEEAYRVVVVHGGLFSNWYNKQEA
jgi:hypothetical protein